MSNEITDTHSLAGVDDDNREVATNMSATREPENTKIEFHVQMRSYTQSDMEELIVDAAARVIVGRSNNNELSKRIESRAIEMINERVTAHLSGITAEIIDQPVTPSYGDKKPLTMREVIGLTGREYLTAKVDGYGRAQGEKDFDSYHSRDHGTRIAHIVSRAMDIKFKDEITKATSDAIREFRAALEAQHKAVIAAEMARFHEALSKATASK